MNENHLVETSFPEGTEVWTDPEDGGRDDEYITAKYDIRDGTYSLTYHPGVGAVTIPCFVKAHAAIALKDAGFSFPQIVKILGNARDVARRAV